MMRNLILIIVVFMVYPAFGQKKRPGDTGLTPVFTEGITYSLPRAGLRIHVEAVKETFEPGPYAQYASQLLGIGNVRNKAAVSWNISNVEFDAFSEPDPDQVYKAMGDMASLVVLSSSGCLAGINSKSVQSEVQELKTLTYIPGYTKNDEMYFSQFNHSSAYSQGDSSSNYRPVRQNNEEKAVQAAKRIFECRNTRFNIVSGLLDEFHPDGRSYEISLRELEKIERGYLSLFTGRTTHEKQNFSFNFLPSASSEKGDVVFRFSEEGGVLPAANLTGKPVILKVEPEKVLVSKFSELAKSENPAGGSSGVFYRMPAMATINLIYELNTIASTRMLLPQFGKVAPIPEELLFGEYGIEIHPETGAVKSVSKK